MTIKAKGLLVLISCLSGIAAQALSTDNQEPLHATCDSLEFQQLQNTATLAGKVNIHQGTTHLTADKLTVQLAPDRQVKSAIANGNPATYITKTQPEKPELVANSNQIEYYPQEHHMILTGNSYVVQGPNSYRANIIHYDTLNEMVSSPKLPGNRATIILQPEDKK